MGFYEKKKEVCKRPPLIYEENLISYNELTCKVNLDFKLAALFL